MLSKSHRLQKGRGSGLKEGPQFHIRKSRAFFKKQHLGVLRSCKLIVQLSNVPLMRERECVGERKFRINALQLNTTTQVKTYLVGQKKCLRPGRTERERFGAGSEAERLSRTKRGRGGMRVIRVSRSRSKHGGGRASRA